MQTTSTRYKLFLLILSPLALAHIVYRSFKDGGLRYFKQRLGFGYTKFQPSSCIHFHCASVGEFITAKPLINALHAAFPTKQIVISTNTPTSASLVSKMENKEIIHHYFPIDLAFCVKRFLKNVQPIACFILETEIWPTFYSFAAKKFIPISIINARLSNKTLHANNFIKNEYANALKNVSQVLARSKQDHTNYVNLGASPKVIQTLGNLKYSINNTNNKSLACTTIKRPFFFAASTHEDEESQLSEHIELLRRKNYLLVIAPRYPNRCKSLAQQFRSKNLQVALRSQHDEINDTTDIYIVDTLGELDLFYNEAALVFVGGSLIERGGHNILEPANFGKCIIVGPHTENFELETKELLQADAIIQIKDNHALGLQLVWLLKNDLQREEYGENAIRFVEQQSGILGTYINSIQPIIQDAIK